MGYQEHEFAKAAWPSPHDRRDYQRAAGAAARAGRRRARVRAVQSTYMHGQGLMVPVVGELTAVHGEDGAAAPTSCCERRSAATPVAESDRTPEDRGAPPRSARPGAPRASARRGRRAAAADPDASEAADRPGPEQPRQHRPSGADATACAPTAREPRGDDPRASASRAAPHAAAPRVEDRPPMAARRARSAPAAPGRPTRRRPRPSRRRWCRRLVALVALAVHRRRALRHQRDVPAVPRRGHGRPPSRSGSPRAPTRARSASC